MKEFIALLKEFVAIRSVSTDPKYLDEIKRASLFLASYLERGGLDARIIKGFDNPIVIAKTKFNLKLQTILVYGHYDVQPGVAFDLVKKKGRLYGRGSTDNKGQILMHLYMVIKLMGERNLNYNVTFLIEGNEETGSPNLRKFINKYKRDLKCDCVLISDGELGPNNRPAIEASFRGVANFEVVLKTGKDDAHSGIFGGMLPNAGEELAKIIGSLDKFIDRGGKPASINFGAVEVTSLQAGYMGPGFRNSIPCEARAKINVRSTPKQDPKKLVEKLKKFISRQVPRYAEVKFVGNEYSPGAVLDLENEFSHKAIKVLREVYEEEPVKKSSGGTLPIVNDFKEILKVPQVMVPLANEDCGMHSASENISLEAIKNGLAFSYKFFSKSGSIK